MSNTCVGPNCKNSVFPGDLRVWTKVPPESIFNVVAPKAKMALERDFRFCVDCARIFRTGVPRAYTTDGIVSLPYDVFWEGVRALTAPRPYRDSKTEKSQDSFFDFQQRILNLPPKSGKSTLFSQAVQDAILRGGPLTIIKPRGAGKADLRRWFEPIDLGKWFS